MPRLSTSCNPLCLWCLQSLSHLSSHTERCPISDAPSRNRTLDPSSETASPSARGHDSRYTRRTSPLPPGRGIPISLLSPLPAYARELESRLGRDRVLASVPLAPLTTFRIGGAADLMVRAQTADELVAAIEAVRDLGIPHFLLGAGANILVDDAGFRGVVIRCEIEEIEWIDDLVVRAGAGVRTFPDLIVDTIQRGRAGLHHYVGIPSTVGGALWQNLHFLSPDRERTCFIEEVLAGAEILTEEGERRRVGVDYFEFGYDDSILHRRDDIVLSADFRLESAPEEELREVVRANLEWRDERHPDLWLYPSAGSIFQKIDGVGAGRLIDECGLKGRVHGGAAIFHRHANIIVNMGGASSADVRALIEIARETVLRETGYELVPEIGFLGGDA
ncbi:MAG: UDP-N-acetylmuramate dehydrogenase [Longimicrobiales bacterium]|nr:UDP-N-acetylmuramate dehydrogenase [Longimicrobiales bacterium]